MLRRNGDTTAEVYYMTLSVADLRKLHDRAGGECSFPQCTTRDVLEEAHIFARNDAGPRGDATLDKRAREVYGNFILLCANHHTLIDREHASYPEPMLREMKAAHERDIAARGVRVTDFTGKVHAEGTDGKRVTGARVTKPTRFRAGTEITASGTRVEQVTGLEITGDTDER